MASVRSKLLNIATRWLMRYLFRVRGRPALYRASFARLDEKSKRRLPRSIAAEDVEWPAAGRWLRHATALSSEPSRQVILYLHGGAFVMRLPNGHTSLVARLCVEAGVSTFMAWYRLAPEHAFPAAGEDCLRAYRSMLEGGHAPADIVIMGDSAGGNLALVMPHLIRKAGLPMPAGVIALSPITDFAQVSATWRLNNRRDPMYRVQGFVNPVEWYLQGASPINPLASPYYGDFTGFPPLYFMVGGIEALLDDSIGMARKAIDAGIPAKVQIWAGMPHVFVLNEMIPEAAQALQELAGWLVELRTPAATRAPLYRSCVELFDRQALTGTLRRETNDVFLGPPP